MTDPNPFKSPNEPGEPRDDHLPKALFVATAIPFVVALVIAVAVILGIVF